MKKAAALLLIPILFGSGCASWQEGANTTLNIISKATDTTRTIGLSTLEVECGKIANECFNNGDTACPNLVACQDKRESFAQYVFAVYQSLFAANVALSFENETSAKEYIKKTQKLLLELYKVMELLAPGVFPKASELEAK